MQRAVGAFLVVIGGTLYGLGAARSMHARVRELSDTILALQTLESEILFAHTPLPDACERVARSSRGSVRRLFTLLGTRLSSPNELNVARVWSDSLRSWALHAHLESEELDTLAALGAMLGRTSAEDQVRTLRYTADRLANIRARLEGDVEKQSRMRIYFGVAGGVALAILLV